MLKSEDINNTIILRRAQHINIPLKTCDHFLQIIPSLLHWTLLMTLQYCLLQMIH